MSAITIIPTARTSLLLEMGTEVEPAEINAEAQSAGGKFYRIKPSSRRSAQKLSVPMLTEWRRAIPLATTPRVHPWDIAHEFASTRPSASFPPIQFVEPDYLNQFIYESPPETREMLFANGKRACELGSPDPTWPSRPELAWHLNDEFSQLAAARAHVGHPAGNRVRIAILDTGFDPDHSTLPANYLFELQKDFADDDLDATDPGNHSLGNNSGHGTGTLSILAGGKVQPSGVPDFDDFIGGAPHAEIVPIRIANSVIQFFASAIAEGLEYAIASNCRVVSISMGGAPSRRWAHAVNAAYDAGVTICAAAGNNVRDGFPTREIVWPARFQRVIGVCGASADKDPYYRPGLQSMQGNFGPAEKMHTAIAAYTPNMPWAEIGCSDVISRRGAGTSSATPQVAAAASLWLQHRKTPDGIEPWQVVEAVRHALFSSADKTPPDCFQYFGQGLLSARNALDVPFEVAQPKTPRDHVWFPLLNLTTGFDKLPLVRRRMLEVEAAQLAAYSPALNEVLPELNVGPEQISLSDRKRVVEILRDQRGASDTFRDFIVGTSV